MNRTPTVAIHNVTPKEKYTDKKPNLSHMKVFGCIAYVHVLDEPPTKLDPKSRKNVCLLVFLLIKKDTNATILPHVMRE